MPESIDWEQFDAVVGDGSDGMTELFQEFVADVNAKLARLAQCVVNQDGTTIAWDAHQMKGSAGSFGMKAFADEVAALEDQAKHGNLSQAGEAIPRLGEIFQASISRIRAERPTLAL